MNKSLPSLLIKEQILKQGKFKLRSGKHSSYYVDIKEALGNPKVLQKICGELVKLIPKDSTCIAGSGYGGIPLATLVAYKKMLPLVLVRDKSKKHGTKKLVDGYVPNNDDFVCIIDDVFTTGGSIKNTKRNLLKTKCRFVKPVVVLNRSKNVSALSLLTDRDLLN